MTTVNVAAACLLTVVGVFIVSASSKLATSTARADFASTVAALGLPRARLTAPVVAPAELLVAALVAAPATRPAGLAAAAGLLCAFSAVVVRAITAGTDVACRCFGAASEPMAGVHLLRNAVLLAAVAVGATASSAVLGRDRASVTATALVGAFGIVLIVYFVEIASLFRKPRPQY